VSPLAAAAEAGDSDGAGTTDRCATLAAVTDDRPSPRPRDAAALDRGGPATTALTAADLARMTGGRLLRTSDRRIRGAAVDSRLVERGELFVAFAGEHTDGHRFLVPAARAGAAALLVSIPPDGDTLEALGDTTVVLVDDGLRGLHAIAAGWRARFDPLVVGVTGSIAKTSTKEAIATVLAADRRTLRSEGNQNNEIGLPLTLLRLAPNHEAAVLEMGMYAGGEIRELTAMARPRIGVVTAVLGVHLSRIGSIDAIEDAKAELVEALPKDGVAILNADDPRVRRMGARTPASVLTYGFADDADVGAEDVASAGLGGMTLTLRIPAGAAPGDGSGAARRVAVSVASLGRLSVHNALAAAAVGWAAGMRPEAIAAALRDGWSAPHRGQVVQAGRITIIDDAYNASPASVRAALELLAGLPGRHVAVLGQMLELGPASIDGHREVGRAAAACELLCVVGAGSDVDAMAAAAIDAGLGPDRLVRAPSVDMAADRLSDRLEPGDVVLVKASRGVALERLVDALVERFGGDSEP